MEELKVNNEFLTSQKIISELKQHGIIKKPKERDIQLDEKSPIYSIRIILKGSIKVYQTDDDYREMFLYYLKSDETCILYIFGVLHSETSAPGVVHYSFINNTIN